MVFIVNQVFAQTDFRKGYVITLQHDTLFGYVNYASSEQNSKRCLFKPTLTAVEKEYLPGEINGYRFEGSKFYVSKQIKLKDSIQRIVFLEFLIEGKVSVYLYKEGVNFHYILEKEGLPLREASFDESIVYKDEVRYFKKDNSYIGVLHVYMQDAPEMFPTIDRLKNPGHEDFIRIAKNYHNIVCKNNDCVIYEKKLPLFSFSLEPVVGISKFKSIDKPLIEYGLLGYIWLPRDNERMYLKTGLLKIQDITTEYLVDAKLFYVPLQFEYLFPKALIRPKFYGGINNYFYKDDYGSDLFYTYTVGAGAMVSITQNLGVCFSVNTDFRFSSFLMDKGTGFYIMNYTALCGLNYRF